MSCRIRRRCKAESHWSAPALVACALALGTALRVQGQGIQIEDGSWFDYTVATEVPADADALCASQGQPPDKYAFVCETADGVVFAALRGRCPILTYGLEVTSIPAGKTRFPVLLSLRRIASPNEGVLNVHNETTGSFLTFSLSFLAATARVVDDAGADETLPFDTLDLPGGGLYDSTDPGAGGRAPSQVTTALATIALAEGNNVIRFDSCQPTADGDHAQVFALGIGPSEAELDGFVLAGCAVSRKIEPGTYGSGDPLTVTLSFSGVPNGTTATESIPAGMSVTDAGGGTVSGNEITFAPDAGDSTATYVLDSGDVCGTPSFTGTYAGSGECLGTISGDTTVSCVGDAGIRIEGEDLLGFASSEPPIDPENPCGAGVQICTTLDNVYYLNPDTAVVREFNVVYLVSVEALPGGVELLRVPVALRARRDYTGNGKLGIRNATTNSWIGFKVSEGATEVGSEEGLRETISSASYTLSPFDSTDSEQGGVPPSLFRSSSVGLALVPGMNEIRVENFGTGGPGDSDGDNPHLFLISFGPDLPDLMGGLCVRSEPIETTCDDGVDDDCDGLVDAADPDCVVAKPVFHRGDPNGDGEMNISDGIFVLNYLFIGGQEPACLESGNANDDGAVDITDGIFILNFLFLGGLAPELPGPPGNECGEDPTSSVSDLGCASYPNC